MSLTSITPPHSDELRVAFPENHVLLLTFNRPKSLNAMTPQMASDLKLVLDWFEDEPSLWYVLLHNFILPGNKDNTHLPDDSTRVVIVTGAGRTFCAGADLKACVLSRYASALPLTEMVTLCLFSDSTTPGGTRINREASRMNKKT